MTVSGTFWTLARIADALRDELTGAIPRDDRPLARITTDTRRIAPGDCFVALIGEKFDAHDFLRDAIDLGAAAIVVSRPGRTAGLGVPVFAVRDTLVALGALARYRRRAWNGTVIGVGGSNGKTTTKELIRAALGATLEVHATTGNLNNLIGVPLTLLAMPDDADVAVIEMGMNVPGEMARLRAIVEPDIAVMTSVSEEHLEGLGSLEGVMREESEIFDGAEVAIVPASQPEIAEAAKGRATRVVRAGLDAGDVRATRWSAGRGRRRRDRDRRRDGSSAGARRAQSAERDARARGGARARASRWPTPREEWRARPSRPCAWRWDRSGRGARR